MKKVKNGKKAGLIGGLVFLVLAAAVVLLGWPDRSVSFMGSMQSRAMLFNTLILQHQTPEEMAATPKFEEYVYGNWDPPAGYTNEKITLTNCSAYFLSKEGGNHDRVIYQIHGGAYVLGFYDQYNTNAVLLSKSWEDCDVLSLDYRTAAQEPYPAALNDAVEGYRWLLDKGYRAESIVFEGDSAGGGLAIATALKLRDDGAQLPRCLVLGSPWADLSQEGDSYTYNRKKDSFFGCLDDDAVGQRSLPTTYADGDSVYNPYISPVYADFENMPPMLIQVVDTEMLLSDSLTVAERAEAAGVPVQLKQYKGLWHVFYIGEARFREQKEAWNTIKEYLKNLP